MEHEIVVDGKVRTFDDFGNETHYALDLDDDDFVDFNEWLDREEVTFKEEDGSLLSVWEYIEVRVDKVLIAVIFVVALVETILWLYEKLKGG